MRLLQLLNLSLLKLEKMLLLLFSRIFLVQNITLYAKGGVVNSLEVLINTIAVTVNWIDETTQALQALAVLDAALILTNVQGYTVVGKYLKL